MKNFIVNVRPKNYGRSIPIIASELIKSTLKEKRFYLAIIYFVAFPLLILLITNIQPAIQTGTGVALFEAHGAIRNYVLFIYTSFFLGQVFIVLLNADAISGEVEENTLPLLRSKPIYDSEIIFGKFFGMVVIISLLDFPVLLIIYITNLAKFDAKFPDAYLYGLDEIFGAILFIILIQSVIIALTLVFSTIFSRSLYSILSSLLGLFVIAQIAGALGEANNYISFDWLVNATLPKMLYHLEPLDSSTPSLLTIFMGIITVIASLLISSILILRRKELT
jgi:ABC-type transport system involved in multi-copper enzyme maturation permease subunit